MEGNHFQVQNVDSTSLIYRQLEALSPLKCLYFELVEPFSARSSVYILDSTLSLASMYCSFCSVSSPSHSLRIHEHGLKKVHAAAATALIRAEVKLGEILEANQTHIHHPSVRGSMTSLPPDITHKQSHQAQTLSKNRYIVEEAKKKARAEGEIPTASTSGFPILRKVTFSLQMLTGTYGSLHSKG